MKTSGGWGGLGSFPVYGVVGILEDMVALRKCASLMILLTHFFFGFSRQRFSVVSEAVLELALVDQAGLEVTEIHLPLPPKCWD